MKYANEWKERNKPNNKIFTEQANRRNKIKWYKVIYENKTKHHACTKFSRLEKVEYRMQSF